MNPAWLVRNLTPTSTDPASGSPSVPGVAVSGQIEHGHPLLEAAAVVKVHVLAVMVLPVVSLAPDTVTVYAELLLSGAVGVKVTVWVLVLYDVVPATTVPFDAATLTELRAELEGIFNRYATRIIRDQPDLPRTTMHLALARKVD